MSDAIKYFMLLLWPFRPFFRKRQDAASGLFLSNCFTCPDRAAGYAAFKDGGLAVTRF
jgi:hypothetical protein